MKLINVKELSIKRANEQTKLDMVNRLMVLVESLQEWLNHGEDKSLTAELCVQKDGMRLCINSETIWWGLWGYCELPDLFDLKETWKALCREAGEAV